VAGHGRSPSTGAVIKDPLESIVDHAAVLLQGGEVGDDPFGATNLAMSGHLDPVKEYPFWAVRMVCRAASNSRPYVVQYQRVR
jgi:hypothetical protein